MEKSRKPKIRFKGYNDDWEQRELGEIADFYTGNGLSWNDISENGSQECILYGNLYTDYGMIAENVVYRTNTVINTPVYSEFGDVLIPASDTTPTGLARATSIEKSGVLLGGDINIVRPKKSISGSYLSLAINRNKGELIKLIKGTTVRHIHNSEIKGVTVSLPNNLCEQEIITECFRNLDNLITLHQRKLEKLMNVKKSMLEKMFPKQGSTVPEIRFNGFTQAWEQRELGELASSFEYGLNAASKCYDGINKYIRITDIDDETRTFLDTDLTSPDCDLSLSENYLLKDGDILFARTGASAGKTFIYKAFNGVVYYAGFLIRARLKENCSPQFVFYNTLTKEYEKFIRVTSQRSGQPGVNAHEYATFELLLPKYDEQCEIGKFFTNLDYLITLHQRKLEKLKNIKKSMLEKMFI